MKPMGMTLLGLLLPLVLPTVHGAEAGLLVKMGDDGPASIRWNDVEILDPTSFGVGLTDSNGQAVPLTGVGERRCEDNTVVRNWPELELRCTWTSKGSEIGLTLQARNTGTASLGGLTVTPLTVAFPRRPDGGRWWWGYDMMTESDGELGLVEADWGEGKALFCLEAADKPCVAGFAGNFGNSKSNAVRISLAPGERLEPGLELTWKISLRFAASGTPSEQMAGDLYRDIARKFPWRLAWSDRRPIGAIFLARDNTGWKTNPRGWFNDDKVDITTDVGRQAFHIRLLEEADRCIGVIQGTGGQGMILWDVEGAEMPHAITYLGDPRVLPAAAPEMDACADDYFKRFRDAGLKVGICIRPSRVIPDPKGGWMHQQVEDPVADMADKIAYAKKRWGCTIFYMDTNVVWPLRGEEDPTRGMWQGNSHLLTSRQMSELVQRHPDVLIFPEFGRFGYYSCCMPYGELGKNGGGDLGVPEGVRVAWPKAGRTIKIGDGDYLLAWDALLAGAMAGDIHLFRGWFPDTPNPAIRHCYQEAEYARHAQSEPFGDLLAVEPEVRYAAVAALAKPNADEVAKLAQLLPKESDWVVRRKMVMALGDSGLAAAVPVLAALLESPGDLDVFAIRSLGRIGPPATKVLAGIATGDDPARGAQALRALSSYEDPAVDATFLPLTRHGSADVRAQAVAVLGPENEHRLQEMLLDPDTRVRQAVCRALGQHRVKAAIPSLVQVMRTAVNDMDLLSAAGSALEQITGQQYGPHEHLWGKALKDGVLK